MPAKIARLAFCTLALSIACSCSPKPSPASLLIGTWEFQLAGMNWEWSFAADSSLKWSILGQTDMGGRRIDISGSGSYRLEGAVLALGFEKFAGVPGILRPSDAAPGFDPGTKVALRFAGKDAMAWSFSTRTYGAEEIEAVRRK